MMKRHLSAVAGGLCLALAALIAAPSVQAKDDALIIVSAGLFDIEQSRSQEFEGRLEYRASWGFLGSDGAFRGFKPLVGVMANTAESTFVYAGLAAPFAFGDGLWEIVPAAGMGAYSRGDGISLGGTFEFHLGLGASYRITPNSRLGIAVNHISNANTHRKNPGVNSILATWSFAFNGF